MSFANNLQVGLNRIIELAGTQIQIDYFTPVYDDVYDESSSLVISGTLNTSGVIFPLNTKQGSADSVLLEQGKIIDNDKKLYVNGSLTFTGSDLKVRVTIGTDTYTTIPLGAIEYEAQGEGIYRKVYIRRLTNGSLFGE